MKSPLSREKVATDCSGRLLRVLGHQRSKTQNGKTGYGRMPLDVTRLSTPTLFTGATFANHDLRRPLRGPAQIEVLGRQTDKVEIFSVHIYNVEKISIS